MTYTWVEPFAGAAACALRLVGGSGLTPPVAWMGGKRRYARVIADAMGVPEVRPARVVLCDAGPWGWIWTLLLDTELSRAVSEVLRGWAEKHPRELWERLADQPPAECLHERAAQWLWLQARSASGVPVWWSGWRVDRLGEANARRGSWRAGGGTRRATDRGQDLRWPGHRAEEGAWLQADHGTGRVQRACQGKTGSWEQGSGEGRPPQPAGQRGDKQTWRMGEEQKKSRRGDRTISQGGTSHGRAGGMVNPATIAERIEAVALAFARVAVEVHHDDVHDLRLDDVTRRQTVYAYLDPPYVGATGYGWDCPRESVLALARAWQEAGAVVAVSEAEPLDLSGWHHLELTRTGGKPEWLTLSRPPARRPAQQASLFPAEAP